MKFYTFLLLIVFLFIKVNTKQFAVLVSGSQSFWNYRHQADVCHGYQVLINKGIPQENIIVMSYNDCPNSEYNIYPGTLFNKSSGKNPGNNVYENCNIDYEGDDVTVENYQAILTGNKSQISGGNGRVLESTSDDEVFLYYSDHGSPGFVQFPNDKHLYADELVNILKQMYEQKMYKQLTFYMEACNSGSMFQDLPDNLNIYVVTAANPFEVSYATYCYPDDIVDGEHIWTCLGDEFSDAWMTSTENSNTKNVTLQQQFDYIEGQIQSNAQQFGDLSFTDESIGVFLGQGNNQDKYSFSKKLENLIKSKRNTYLQQAQTMDSRDSELQFWVNLYKRQPTQVNFGKVVEYFDKINIINSVLQYYQEKYPDVDDQLKNLYYNNKLKINFQCYRETIQNVKKLIGMDLNDYGLSQLKYVYLYCNENI